MQGKIRKQKKKIILRIGIIFLAVWLIVSVIFSVAVLYLKADRFESETFANHTKFQNNLNNIYTTAYSLTLCNAIDNARMVTPDYLSRTGVTKSYLNDFNIYDADLHIAARMQTATQEYLFDTNEITVLNFSYVMEDYETRNSENGIISYSDLTSSMTQEQYESICSYLAVKPDKQGNYYELLCTEYYYDEEKFIIKPETLQIVLSNQQHYWYAEDTVIETYHLSPKDTEGCVARRIPRDARSVIPDKFITGEFIYENTSYEDYDIPDDVYINVDYEIQYNFPFEYIYNGYCHIHTYLLEDASDSVVSNENTSYYSYGDASVELHYTRRINLLRESLPVLITGYCISFLFLFFIGMILGISLWQIIKTQAQEEQNRREVTNALAHDIKTPLFIIEGYAQSLKENLHTDKREHYADRIMERTRECNRLVHQMLNFSSLDSPDFSLATEEVEVESLLREVIADFSQVSDTSRVHLEAGVSCTVSADRELLKRALTNLLDNALRYSDEGTDISIILTGKQLSISNICSTLTKEDIDNLTKPFYRAEKSRGSEGSGLGLSMVESVAKHHGFTLGLNFENKVFTVTLVLKK